MFGFEHEEMLSEEMARWDYQQELRREHEDHFAYEEYEDVPPDLRTPCICCWDMGLPF